MSTKTRTELMERHHVALNKESIKKVLTIPWSGANYSENIWKREYNIAHKIRTLVTRNIIEGKSIDNLTKLVTDELGKDYKNAARTLIHTETAYVKGQADLEVYKRLGVVEYEFLSTLDNKTSDVCRRLDKKHFGVDEAMPGKNYPPMHPRCRSITIVYTKDQEGKTRTDRDKDGKSYDVPLDMDYKKWYNKYIKGLITEENDEGKGVGNNLISIEIDRFTDCLYDKATGLEVDTIVEENFIPKEKDYKGWNFKWDKPYKEGFKITALKVVNNNDIQGMLATKIEVGGVYVKMIEAAPHNIGNSGRYEGVGAHLFAIACKEAQDKGYDFIYFDAKTNLINYYRKKLGATQIGTSQRMFIDGEAFEVLIKKYFKEGKNEE